VPGTRFREESVALNQSRGSYPLVYIATLTFAVKIVCVVSLILSNALQKYTNYFTMLFVPCMSVTLLSTSWPNTKHILLQSNCTYSVKLYSDVSMAVTTVIRDENTPDQKTLLFQDAFLVTHTSLYFASPFNTELFVSHFPRVNFLRPQWNRNFITSLKSCQLRVF